MNKNELLKRIQLGFLICIIFMYLILSNYIRTTNLNNTILLFFVINGSISLFMIIKSSIKLCFSTKTFFWIFNFFFFFVAPFLQYINESWCLNYKTNDETILFANFLVFLWINTFIISDKIKMKKKIKFSSLNHKKIDTESRIPSKNACALLLIISFFILIYMIFKFGLYNLISSRSGVLSAFSGDESSVSLLLLYCCRNFVTFTAYIFAYNNKKYRMQFIVSIFFLIITCSPIAMPRFQAAVIYMGLFLIIRKDLVKNVKIIYIFLFGFMFIFPFINAFRYLTVGEVNILSMINNVFNNIKVEYLSANYDAFVMLMKAIDYIGINGFSFGNQLLGALLFFVPRSLWINKPIGTSFLIQHFYGFSGGAANTSCSLLAEGYFDFGIIGIILYSFVLNKVCSYIDDIWLKNNENIVIFDYKKLIFFVFPTLIFFLQRGALNSVFSFICSYIFIGLVVYKLSQV